MNLKPQNNRPKPTDYEAKYKDLLQSMAEGYFENDLKGNITFVNAAYCRLINKPPEEILNHNFRELVSPNSVMKLSEAFSGIYNKRGDQKLWEHSFFYEDGRLKVFEISVSLLKDESGRIQGFRGFLRDMTSREGSSIPVRESEERLKTILNQMNTAILIIDPETHRIVWANPAVLRMTGYSMDEVIGSLCHRFVCPAQSGECPITDLGQKVENSERMLLDKNGNEISIFKSVLEIHFNGKPHLLESFINISRMKKIQKELELSKIAAENANRAKSEFLANMSHELRTPLNHIMGFSELVLDPAFGVLNEIQKEYISDIHNSSSHLLALINDILDLSKVEAGKMELEASAVAIKRLLSNSLLMVKEKSLKKGIQLHLKMEEGVPEIIVADERKIKQILYNLLSNSIKFTPPGGTIVMGAGVLTSDSDDPGQSRLKIWVTDSGVGIAKENLHRIFDYFEQIENSTTKRHEGTGIGLTLTKRLVELHGGRIQAESDGEGKGSTFFFTLPM
jgi:PAS domain S-box-containing protein